MITNTSMVARDLVLIARYLSPTSHFTAIAWTDQIPSAISNMGFTCLSVQFDTLYESQFHLGELTSLRQEIKMLNVSHCMSTWRGVLHVWKKHGHKHSVEYTATTSVVGPNPRMLNVFSQHSHNLNALVLFVVSVLAVVCQACKVTWLTLLDIAAEFPQLLGSSGCKKAFWMATWHWWLPCHQSWNSFPLSPSFSKPFQGEDNNHLLLL